MSSKKLLTKKRAIDGVLLLDKPQGLTSNTALQRVKGLFSANKAGHTGSLDPLATGMLPICFGQATKFSSYLLDADKHYQVEITLGSRTDTADSEGSIIETSEIPIFTEETISKLLEQFHGVHQQVPPMYSALKYQGRALYAYAREGITIARAARQIEIYDLKLLDFTPQTITLAVHCSKGTYIRVLAEDMGRALGCCAHVSMLRRTQVSDYLLEMMVSLPELERLAETGDAAELDKKLLTVSSMLTNWPVVNVSQEDAVCLRNGRKVIASPVKQNEVVVLHAPGGVFLGLGERRTEGSLAAKRLMAWNGAN